MKTTDLFKATVAVAMIFVSGLSVDAQAQENQFITNEEMKDEMVVTKTIFRQDGSLLFRHLRYEYSYDELKRLTVKEAFKWNAEKEEWMPYFKMNYRYTDKEIVMSYARWNESHKAYDKNVQESIQELNEQNMPLACNLRER